MSKLQGFHGLAYFGKGYPVASHPDTCPLCHHAIEPQFLAESNAPVEKWDDIRELVYQCPRLKCSHLFIGRFRLNYNPQSSASLSQKIQFNLMSLVPTTPAPVTVSDEIRKLSPNFLEIYTQSKAAEAFGLEQVCGVGYRKSLEFLIKDYCIVKRPADAAAIRKVMLGPCIENYVSDVKVKECAKRATWLGNDETHYERRWTSHDLGDMKVLIRLTMAWIEHELLTDQYLASMPAKA